MVLMEQRYLVKAEAAAAQAQPAAMAAMAARMLLRMPVVQAAPAARWLQVASAILASLAIPAPLTRAVAVAAVARTARSARRFPASLRQAAQAAMVETEPAREMAAAAVPVAMVRSSSAAARSAVFPRRLPEVSAATAGPVLSAAMAVQAE
jgi:hypothetical protein